MSEISNYMENLIINHMLRAVAYTPVVVYVALFTQRRGLRPTTQRLKSAATVTPGRWRGCRLLLAMG